MHVLAVLNQKGGSGKTTIATNLARAFQLEGLDVLLVDSDPQGSARDWAASREDQPVPVVGIDRPTISRDLKRIANTDLVIIDGAPQAADLAASAIKAATAILIPVQPSPYDIWAASELVDLVHQRKELMDGELPAAFVIARAITGTRLGEEVTEALEPYGLPVLETRIHQRVIYPGSAASGLSVYEAGADARPAVAEMKALANEIAQKLFNVNEVMS
jgi:chromosome partitioning protein